MGVSRSRQSIAFVKPRVVLLTRWSSGRGYLEAPALVFYFYILYFIIISKILLSELVYSQMWLNLVVDDCQCGNTTTLKKKEKKEALISNWAQI
jgi:hypothetical protein